MMERHPAWLLRAADDVSVAVAQHEMIEFVTDARVRHVPLANPHCNQLALWRDTLVPVLDLPRLLHGVSTAAHSALGVVAYQTRAQQPLQYLAIWIDAPPQRIDVGDAQACELPETWHDVRPLALACFSHAGTAVPILNLANVACTSYDPYTLTTDAHARGTALSV